MYKLLLFVLVGFHHTSKAASANVTEAADTSVVSIYKRDKQGAFRCFNKYLRCLSSGVGRLACLTTYLSYLSVMFTAMYSTNNTVIWMMLVSDSFGIVHSFGAFCEALDVHMYC